MSIKKHLQNIQEVIPEHWLYQLQDIHSSILSSWILGWGSKPLKFTGKSAMVFSPHQDDETFGCGGMIALKRKQGINVAVTFLTDGRGSSDSQVNNQNKIIQIRKQESLTALNILGVEPENIHFLNKLDGSLRELTAEEKQETINEVVELLKHYQPGEVYVPHYKDCHRDHEATYDLVKTAIAQAGITLDILQYPIWLFWRAPLFILLKLSDIRAAYCLDINAVQPEKNKAIAAYPSQTENLPKGFIKQFLISTEIFFKDKQ
ncbi:PIG-L family deacetylase [Cronbergia sp. UHCC 0137]|uniref:PIG-L deacetylase family protein n=1 Tax=Cronbergia sp. UHCC 0137 TaxID=3110239 RepID=UPI002B1FB1F5|nr:PIG-L family deacetylase [Cronbergia sp. UHCC 0137]MEA5619679.1 PIG-L family deacetylase [Cronbergia sp. UHCC 0137]